MFRRLAGVTVLALSMVSLSVPAIAASGSALSTSDKVDLGEAAGFARERGISTAAAELHHETACRSAGALALRPMDLDEEQCLIRLREKGGTERWQPISPTLMAHLIRFAKERNAPRDGRLLPPSGVAPSRSRRARTRVPLLGTQPGSRCGGESG